MEWGQSNHNNPMWSREGTWCPKWNLGYLSSKKLEDCGKGKKKIFTICPILSYPERPHWIQPLDHNSEEGLPRNQIKTMAKNGANEPQCLQHHGLQEPRSESTQVLSNRWMGKDDVAHTCARECAHTHTHTKTKIWHNEIQTPQIEPVSQTKSGHGIGGNLDKIPVCDALDWL